MKKKPMLIVLTCLMLLAFYGCGTEPQNSDNDTGTTVVKMTEDLPFATYYGPALVGDEMYICVGETTASTGKLIDYNIKTKEYKVIFESQFSDAAVQGTMANDDWVIWTDSDAKGYYNNIYALNRTSNKVTKIIEYEAQEGGYMIVAPYLSGNVISWLEFKEINVATVMFCDLQTGEIKEIGSLNEPSFYNTFVYVDGNQVLWTDSLDERGYYFLYNIDTAKTQRIEAPFRYPGYAKMSNGLIYSINFEDYHNWTSHEFGCYNISTKIYSPVDAFKGTYINLFRQKNKILAVMDRENELHIFDTETGKPLEFTSPLEKIDTIDISEDGRVIAGVEGTQDSNPTIVIIDTNN